MVTSSVDASRPRNSRYRLVAAVVTVLLAAGVTAVAGSQVVPPQYVASSLLVLMPPSKPGQNPYLFNGDLFRAVDVLVQTLNDGSEIEQLESQDVPADSWKVAPNMQSSAPSVLITARADTEAIAVTRASTIASRLGTVLARLQTGTGLATDKVVTVAPQQGPPAVREDVGPAVKEVLLWMMAVLAIGGAVILSVSRRQARKVEIRRRAEQQ